MRAAIKAESADDDRRGDGAALETALKAMAGEPCGGKNCCGRAAGAPPGRSRPPPIWRDLDRRREYACGAADSALEDGRNDDVLRTTSARRRKWALKTKARERGLIVMGPGLWHRLHRRRRWRSPTTWRPPDLSAVGALRHRHSVLYFANYPRRPRHLARHWPRRAGFDGGDRRYQRHQRAAHAGGRIRSSLVLAFRFKPPHPRCASGIDEMKAPASRWWRCSARPPCVREG
ncbi:hypothetical protein M8494_20010 [Serratia ureilytica]